MGGHSHGGSDHDARHKVASLTAQLIQKDHRIRGLEQGVQTKLAEVLSFFIYFIITISCGGCAVSAASSACCTDTYV